MNQGRAVAGILVALSAVTAAQAAPLTIAAEVSAVKHLYSNGYGLDVILGAPSGATPVPSFTARFADYDAIDFVIRAPDGYQFVINPWQGAQSLGMNVSLFYNFTSGSNSSPALATTVSFADLSGPGPNNVSINTRAMNGGTSFFMDGALLWDRIAGLDQLEITFTSMTLRADTSRVVNKSTAELAYIPNVTSNVSLRSFMPNNLPGPDQGASIQVMALPDDGGGGQPVDEPGAAALVGAGMMALIAARRRRQRGQEA